MMIRQSLTLSMVLVVITGFLFPLEAFAQNDLVAQALGTAGQISILASLVAVLSYVIGVYFAYKALMALKGFIEKADDNPITHFLAYIITSVLLIYLPYTIGVTANTVDVKTAQTVTSSNVHVSAEGDFPCAMTGTVGDIFCNIAIQFTPVTGLMSVLVYALAAVLILMGLLSLKEYGDDPSRVPFRSIVVKFVLGCFLFSLPLAMELFMTSVTGDASFSTTQASKSTRPKSFSGTIK